MADFIGNAIGLDLAKNKLVVNVPAWDIEGEAERTKLDYYLDVYLPDAPGSNTFTLFETLDVKEKPVETNGGTQIYHGAFFEINKLLLGYLESEPMRGSGPFGPKFGLSKITAISGMVTPYFCVYRVDKAGVELESATLSSRWAIASGISENDFADYGNDYFLNYVGGGRRFLTSKPDSSFLVYGQTEILYWLHQYDFDISKMCLETRAFYKSGAEVTSESDAAENIDGMNVYAVPVEMPKALLDDEVDYFTVQLLDSDDNALSELRTYYVESRYKRNNRFVFFENSLGCFDNVAIHGESSEELTLDVLEGNRFKGYAYSASAAETETVAKSGLRNLLVTLQWSSKEMVAYLTDMALSKIYYLVTDRAHLPLKLTDSSYRSLDDNEDLASREFTFQFSNREEFYSKLPLANITEERPTTWTPLSTACLLDSHGKRTGQIGATVLEKVYLDDGSRVYPRVIKPNVANEEGYIAPAEDDSCSVASTPFKSVLISRASDYKKTDCTDNKVGDELTIVVAVEDWGSEISQADADNKAEAAWDVMNTQAYATANGACVLPSQNGLRSKFWNYDSNVAGFGPTFDFTQAAEFADVETNGNVNVFADTFPDAVTGGIVNDKLVMEFNGFLKGPVSDAVTLISNADDGVRVWIDDVLVLNSWQYNSGMSLDRNASAAALTLNAMHKLRIRFYNASGYAGHTLSWKWTGQGKVAVPDLSLFYI